MSGGRNGGSTNSISIAQPSKTAYIVRASLGSQASARVKGVRSSVAADVGSLKSVFDVFGFSLLDGLALRLVGPSKLFIEVGLTPQGSIGRQAVVARERYLNESGISKLLNFASLAQVDHIALWCLAKQSDISDISVYFPLMTQTFFKMSPSDDVISRYDYLRDLWPQKEFWPSSLADVLPSDIIANPNNDVLWACSSAPAMDTFLRSLAQLSSKVEKPSQQKLSDSDAFVESTLLSDLIDDALKANVSFDFTLPKPKVYSRDRKRNNIVYFPRSKTPYSITSVGDFTLICLSYLCSKKFSDWPKTLVDVPFVKTKNKLRVPDPGDSFSQKLRYFLQWDASRKGNPITLFTGTDKALVALLVAESVDLIGAFAVCMNELLCGEESLIHDHIQAQEAVKCLLYYAMLDPMSWFMSGQKSMSWALGSVFPDNSSKVSMQQLKYPAYAGGTSIMAINSFHLSFRAPSAGWGSSPIIVVPLEDDKPAPKGTMFVTSLNVGSERVQFALLSSGTINQRTHLYGLALMYATPLASLSVSRVTIGDATITRVRAPALPMTSVWSASFNLEFVRVLSELICRGNYCVQDPDALLYFARVIVIWRMIYECPTVLAEVWDDMAFENGPLTDQKLSRLIARKDVSAVVAMRSFQKAISPTSSRSVLKDVLVQSDTELIKDMITDYSGPVNISIPFPTFPRSELLATRDASMSKSIQITYEREVQSWMIANSLSSPSATP